MIKPDYVRRRYPAFHDNLAPHHACLWCHATWPCPNRGGPPCPVRGLSALDLGPTFICTPCERRLKGANRGVLVEEAILR